MQRQSGVCVGVSRQLLVATQMRSFFVNDGMISIVY